eukprot:TRINITY_DN28465_c0_g1_i1.p1 TRINITY_DN28465_c0_g1~~TRINITY_DN28465_c0_g1_i1.p1  ORF type:complete len:281 (+),score=50.76 TRINITY_DN28465_c0_g1_i1:172-1014(+)
MRRGSSSGSAKSTSPLYSHGVMEKDKTTSSFSSGPSKSILFPTVGHVRDDLAHFSSGILTVPPAGSGRPSSGGGSHTCEDVERVVNTVSEIVIEGLLNCIELFIARYGRRIMLSFKEAVMSLPSAELQFVDEWNRTCVDVDATIRALSSQRFPLVLQEAASTFDFIHGNIKAEPPISSVNDEFVRICGWSTAVLNERGLNFIALCHAESLLPFTNELYAGIIHGYTIKRAWADPFQVIVNGVKIMCFDGIYRTFNITMTVFLSPAYVPVTYAIQLFPIIF